MMPPLERTNYRITTDVSPCLHFTTDQLAFSEEQAKSLHWRDLYVRHGAEFFAAPVTTRAVVIIREESEVPA